MKVVGAGTDKTAQLLDLGSGSYASTQVAVHDAPIRAVRFFEHPSSNGPMIVTGSWDKSVRYWDVRAPTGAPASTIQMADRVYAMEYAYYLSSIFMLHDY
jgi:mRNA export factor